MAIMIANDVEEFQTKGEKVFFRFLQSGCQAGFSVRGLVSPGHQRQGTGFFIVL